MIDEGATYILLYISKQTRLSIIMPFGSGCSGRYNAVPANHDTDENVIFFPT